MNDLIMVEKNGEQSWIHPSTLDSHRAAGWKVVELAGVEEETEVEVEPGNLPGIEPDTDLSKPKTASRKRKKAA